MGNTTEEMVVDYFAIFSLTGGILFIGMCRTWGIKLDKELKDSS